MRSRSAFLPGVTDNIAHTVRESIEDLLKMRLDIEKSVFTTMTYFFTGDLTPGDVESICAELHNPLIQRMKILSAEEYARQGGMGIGPAGGAASTSGPRPTWWTSSVPDDELMRSGKKASGTRTEPGGGRWRLTWSP